MVDTAGFKNMFTVLDPRYTISLLPAHMLPRQLYLIYTTNQHIDMSEKPSLVQTVGRLELQRASLGRVHT